MTTINGRRSTMTPGVAGEVSLARGGARAGRLAALLAVLVASAATCPPAWAQQRIEITFQTVAGGAPLAGSGTDTATLSFGTVSAVGVVPPFVTRTTTATDFSVSTDFGVRVKKFGGFTNGYTLQGRLLTPSTLTWAVNGQALTTGFRTIAWNQSFNTTTAHTLQLTVPLASPGGGVVAAVEVLAIAN